MVLIKVEEKDKVKTFEILATNGRFIGLSENRFNILEHADETIEKLKNAGIEPEIIG